MSVLSLLYKRLCTSRGAIFANHGYGKLRRAWIVLMLLEIDLVIRDPINISYHYTSLYFE